MCTRLIYDFSLFLLIIPCKKYMLCMLSFEVEYVDAEKPSVMSIDRIGCPTKLYLIVCLLGYIVRLCS